jgi:hypothetical protein
MHNLSIVPNEDTACTNEDAATERAYNLACFGSKRVLELCVGPSLATLEDAYAKQGIQVTGNDIDKRWAEYYPKGNWIIGNCFEIPYYKFDTVVFAPPLSKGCTGKREDSLMLEEVNPPYRRFVDESQYKGKLLVCVFPGRALATRADRQQMYKFLAFVQQGRFLRDYELLPLKCGRRNITKYYDLYLDYRYPETRPISL